MALSIARGMCPAPISVAFSFTLIGSPKLMDTCPNFLESTVAACVNECGAVKGVYIYIENPTARTRVGMRVALHVKSKRLRETLRLV